MSKCPATGGRLSLLCVFAVGLTVRLWHVFDIRVAPFFPMRLGDSLSYHDWAVEIADGNWLGSEVFYQAPLYPYGLAIVYSLFGTNRLAVMIVQALMGAMSCALICDAGTRLHSRRVGIAAGLIMGCYAPSIFFDSLVQKTAVDQFLLCLIINVIIRWQHQQTLRSSLLIGLSTGLLILSRENSLVFVIAIAPGMMLLHAPTYRASLLTVSVFIAGVAAILFPVAIRNYAVGSEFHLTTSQFGPNFYIGNNRDANGMYQPLRAGGGNAQRERRDATMLAERASGRSLTPGEVSTYWADRTVSDIVGDPGRWLRLMGWKMALLWNRVEVTDTEDMYSYADWSTPLRLLKPVFHFGILAPLAVLGCCLNWHRRRDLGLLVVMLVAYAASVWFFYVFGRYRFPLVPFLCMFAGFGVVDAAHYISKRFRRNHLHEDETASTQLKRSIMPTVLLISAFVFANWPFLNADRMKSISHYNMAVQLDLAGNNREAIRFYRRTLDLNPGDIDAHMNLAELLARINRLKEAEHQYELALQFDEAPRELHFVLANVYARLGRTKEAIRYYQNAIHAMPELVPAYLNLGVALQQEGFTEKAIAALQQAVDLDPKYAAAHLNLAHALADTARFESAVDHYEIVLKLEPGHPLAQSCLIEIREIMRTHRTDR